MTNEEIKQELCLSLDQFRAGDGDLLRRNLSERCITHQLANHIQVQFPRSHVDCEYNRNMDESKNIEVAQEDLSNALLEKYANRLNHLNPEELHSLSTFPDIVVHQREVNMPENLLVVEVKKDDSQVSLDLDRLKLILPTGGAWEADFEIEWFETRASANLRES
jgi:hypothetical protein